MSWLNCISEKKIGFLTEISMSTAYGCNSLIRYCIRVQAYLTIWSLSKFVIYCSFTDHIHTGIVQKILSTFGITLNRVLFFVCKYNCYHTAR